MVASALFGSDCSRWRTPDSIFAPLHAEFDFQIDLAAEACNAKLPIYLSKDNPPGGALAVASLEGARGWCNPPFGGQVTGQWVEWFHRQARDHEATIVALLPCRTDTRWFHDHIVRCAAIRFIKGRITFWHEDTGQPVKNPAPFPCMVVHWQPGAERAGRPPLPKSWDPRG